MEKRPISCLILPKRERKSSDELTKINFEKLKLKKIRANKDGFMKNLLLNTSKGTSFKINSNFIRNQNIRYIKKKKFSKMTPFQVYQNIKMIKKNKIEDKKNNTNIAENCSKLYIISKNKSLPISTKNNNSKKKYILNFQKNKMYNSKIRLKSRNFNILNDYKNMTEFTRMIKRDLLKIEKCIIKKNNKKNSEVKSNKPKKKYNDINKLQIESKNLIYKLKNKLGILPTIKKSLSQVIINKK